MDKDFQLLIYNAKQLAKKIVLNNYIYYGHVTCSIMTISGAIYTGFSINSKCNLGNCAEQHAVMEMLKNNETIIKKMVTYSSKGVVYIPCGKCREFIKMVSIDNLDAEILLPDYRIIKLRELLPYPFIRTE